MKAQVCGTLVFFYLCAALALEELSNFYHNNTELQKALRSLASRHPNLTHLYSIGKSVNGTELEVIRLGALLPVGTPHVKLIGNIHGNEPLGRELLLRLADFLLTSYGVDTLATQILNTTYVHLLPSMNPDGFSVSQEGECMLGPGRRNANKVDLNRNFPSLMYPDDVKTETQPETQAVMEWMHKVPFVLSAALHGGSLVANYPYDVAASKQTPTSDHKTEDDELFKTIAANYSWTHGHMAGETCPVDFTLFPDGITNGAAWYPITGSMQDYNYDFHGCVEITLELSCCKYPSPSDFNRYWIENKMALLNFIQHSHMGVKGVVRNGSVPIARAAVSIVGRKTFQLTSDQGEYWKLLLPGTHFIQVEKDGFRTTIKRVMVPGSPRDNPVVVNIDLGVHIEDNQQPVGLDSIEPDTDGYDLPVLSNNWPFDPSVIDEYEENWKERVKNWTGSEEDDTPISAGKRLSRFTFVLLLPALMIILTE